MAGNAVARRLSERLLGASKKTSVVDRYWSDPAAYAKEKLGASPSLYQAEILNELHRRRRVAVRGPHGLGKTAMAAWAALAFAETREAAGKDWKVVTTAGGWRQLTKYLWPETTKWARRLGTYAPGKELLTMGLKLDHGEAFAVASNKPELIEGAHADEILYIVDEGKAVAESTWDAIEGAFSAGEAYVLALSTPGSALGRFHAIHARKPGLEDWWPRHVTLEEAISAGRVTREWAERRRRQWGEGSPVYRTRVLGEFAEDQDGIIPLAWIEAAIERWREWAEAGRPGERVQTCIGVDVGGGDPGGDRTTIARRSGQVITRLEVYSRGDTMATAGRAVVALRAGGYAHVDSIGVGAGVVARLRELDLELDVRAFVAGGRPKGSDESGELEFANCLTGEARVRPIGELLGVYRSRHEGPLYRVKTAGGDDFTATPNHHVLTGEGWISVKALHVGDKLLDPTGRDSFPMPSVGPEEDAMPATLGEIYRAAHRIFGAERMEARAVNFHGDRPVSDVDVVRIDSELLLVRESAGEHSKDDQLMRSLVPARLFPRLGALSHPFGAGDGDARIRTPFPHDGVPGRFGPALGQRHAISTETVGFRLGAECHAVLDEDAGHGALVLTDGSTEGLDRHPARVAPDERLLVEDDGSPESGRGFLGSKADPLLAEDAPDDVPVDAEGLLEGVERRPVDVALGEQGAVHRTADLESDGRRLVPEVHALVGQPVPDGAPRHAEGGAQGLAGLASCVPSDDVVCVEVLEHSEDPFVYTLWTSSGSYSTTKTTHKNCRAEAWWGMRERLDPSRGSSVCLPPDDEIQCGEDEQASLIGELTAPRMRTTSAGKLVVEEKTEIRKRIGRSTDVADAVIQAFAPVDPSSGPVDEADILIGESELGDVPSLGEEWG